MGRSEKEVLVCWWRCLDKNVDNMVLVPVIEVDDINCCDRILRQSVLLTTISVTAELLMGM